MLHYLKQISTWTGTGSIVGLAIVLGVPEQHVQVIGAAIIALLNVYDLFRNEGVKHDTHQSK